MAIVTQLPLVVADPHKMSPGSPGCGGRIRIKGGILLTVLVVTGGTHYLSTIKPSGHLRICWRACTIVCVVYIRIPAMRGTRSPWSSLIVGIERKSPCISSRSVTLHADRCITYPFCEGHPGSMPSMTGLTAVVVSGTCAGITVRTVKSLPHPLDGKTCQQN